MEGAAALALGAGEDCAKANGDGDGEAAGAGCEVGVPNEGVAPKGDGEAEAPNKPVLPNVEAPKPPPEDAAEAAPPKPNDGADVAPNKLPPAGALPAGVEPNAGAEAVPNENDVGAPVDEALNPVKPDIVAPTTRSTQTLLQLSLSLSALNPLKPYHSLATETHNATQLLPPNPNRTINLITPIGLLNTCTKVIYDNLSTALKSEKKHPETEGEKPRTLPPRQKEGSKWEVELKWW